MRHYLLYLNVVNDGNFFKIREAILDQKKNVNKEEIIEIKKKVEKEKINFLTIVDKNYPEILKRIINPPFVIYYRGNLDLLTEKNLHFLTGEQENSISNYFLTKDIENWSKNITLVTKGWKNFEQKIIQKYKKHSGKGIVYVSSKGVLNPSCWFETKFDFEKDLIISEYFDVKNKTKFHTKSLSRIISGISKAMIIFSSQKKSGIGNQILSFLEENKEIYCYPGNHEDKNDGNYDLINDGISVITAVK